jgi:site-specific DNA-methyltransferase (adenine-specific)
MTKLLQKPRAFMNRTLTLSLADRERLESQVIRLPNSRRGQNFTGIACGDWRDWVLMLPPGHVDLLFLDPPYNLAKSFNGRPFGKQTVESYTRWLSDVLAHLRPLLKATATVYICGDWLTSCSIFPAASEHFIVRNRITWEREKGRGARSNWKNTSEDIWFCTVSDSYVFNYESVKLRRKVLAPYKDSNGAPKDWTLGAAGNFRDTHPSNLWTDITVPFWSMPENTDHPTQKSEKLMAKLILASSNLSDFVLDPFAGSGTTCSVAYKLGRQSFGIEIDPEYCLIAARRAELAREDPHIQGLEDGVFWERNSLPAKRRRPQ